MPKTPLRQHYRQMRRGISEQEQQHHAEQLSKHLDSLLTPQVAHVGFYWPNDGEISPLHFLQQCLSKKISCYLPCIVPGEKSLLFGQVTTSSQMGDNQYGIPEPLDTTRVDVSDIHLLLLPLVAFDLTGNRLGMGGGYYDATLANCQTKPLLVGLAHQCQCAEALPTEHWDHPLDAVATELRLLQFGG